MRYGLRRILTIASIVAVANALLAASSAAAPSSNAYPARPVRWVVPYPAGAANDVITRTVAQKLSASLGQQIVVDNRPGASGTIAAEAVARATPDGYTLLLANPGPSVNTPLLQRDAPYKVDAFAPVVFLGYTPLILVAAPSFEANNARELVNFARAHPGKLSWGSVGYGSSVHIGLALFQAATRIDVVHVPYKGSAQALVDVVSGRIQLMYTSVASAESQIKARRVKVLATAGPKRQAVLPEVQTLTEQGIRGADATNWFGVAVPVATPRANIQVLNGQVNSALRSPDVRQRLEDLGLVIAGGTPEDFRVFLATETDRIRRLIAAGALMLQD